MPEPLEFPRWIYWPDGRREVIPTPEAYDALPEGFRSNPGMFLPPGDFAAVPNVEPWWSDGTARVAPVRLVRRAPPAPEAAVVVGPPAPVGGAEALEEDRLVIPPRRSHHKRRDLS